MKITVSVDIMIPEGMTSAEVVQLFTDHFGYQKQVLSQGQQVNNPQTRAQFARSVIARYVKGAIVLQKRIEDQRALQELSIIVE